MFDDFRLVTDLKTTDNVLLFGKATVFGLKAESTKVARRGSELTRFASDEALFSRIYVTNDVEINKNNIVKLTAMNVGLLSIFLNSQEHQDTLTAYFDNNYPFHETWIVDTNVGRLLMTTASGAPEWLD